MEQEVQEYKWYAVQIQSGSENKIIKLLDQKAKQQDLSECFKEVFVPSQETTEIRRNKKIAVDKKILPGYIMICMKPMREAWHLVRNLNGVYNFLGAKSSSATPLPMSAREIRELMEIKDRISQGECIASTNVNFEIGENVKVNDGPFDGFVGAIEDIDFEKQKLKVSVSIFGRATPIDLDFTQVSKQ